MSLEEALKANTAAVIAQTEMLKTLSGKTAEAASKSTSNSKPAPASDDETPKRGRGRPPKAKTLTATEMGEKAREFCESAGDDEDEFKERRALVSKLAKKFGAGKFSEISGADDQTAALDALNDYLNEGGDGDGDGDNY